MAFQKKELFNSKKASFKGIPKKTGMNKTEAEYAGILEMKKRAGVILWYCYEGIKLKLADNTSYTPDFIVMTQDMELECHEVKGFMRDDAAVKLKVAASLFPFRFILVRRERKEWVYKEY